MGSMTAHLKDTPNTCHESVQQSRRPLLAFLVFFFSPRRLPSHSGNVAQKWGSCVVEVVPLLIHDSDAVRATAWQWR